MPCAGWCVQGGVYIVAPQQEPRPGLPLWTQSGVKVLRQEEVLQQYGPRQVFSQAEALVLLLQATTWKVGPLMMTTLRLVLGGHCLLHLLHVGAGGNMYVPCPPPPPCTVARQDASGNELAKERGIPDPPNGMADDDVLLQVTRTGGALTSLAVSPCSSRLPTPSSPP